MYYAVKYSNVLEYDAPEECAAHCMILGWTMVWYESSQKQWLYIIPGPIQIV
jgi:hypothetical protein